MMKPVDQTKLHSESVNGNCFAAALASIFELPIDDVPDFVGDRWWFDFVNWLNSNGWDVIRWDNKIELLGIYLVAGKSPRGDFDHVVVFENGKMIHDPHPTKQGLGNIKFCMAFLPLDPGIGGNYVGVM